MKLDGRFYGDYRALNLAMEGVEEKARTLQAAGRCVHIVTLSSDGAVLSSKVLTCALKLECSTSTPVNGDSMKRYPIYYDDLETWELVCDDQRRCAVERSGQRAKLTIPLDVFRNTEDGERLAEPLSLAVARAAEDSNNQQVNYFWRPLASP